MSTAQRRTSTHRRRHLQRSGSTGRVVCWNQHTARRLDRRHRNRPTHRGERSHPAPGCRGGRRRVRSRRRMARGAGSPHRFGDDTVDRHRRRVMPCRRRFRRALQRPCGRASRVTLVLADDSTAGADHPLGQGITGTHPDARPRKQRDHHRPIQHAGQSRRTPGTRRRRRTSRPAVVATHPDGDPRRAVRRSGEPGPTGGCRFRRRQQRRIHPGAPGQPRWRDRRRATVAPG